jgi:ATP-dependent protease HslVU (ClpYQ) peptidase subunit
MTCIVGIETDDGVVMGGDSFAGGIYFAQEIACPKVKIIRGGGTEWIMGACGTAREVQLIHHRLQITGRVPTGTDALDKYMVTAFADALRKAFGDGGALGKEDNKESWGGLALVAVRGRIFEIDQGFCAIRTMDGYISTGSGRPYAMGSLHSTRNRTLSPEARVRMALEAAAKFCAGVREPFHILKGAA